MPETDVTAVAAALTNGDPLSQERRQELADLMLPVIRTFEGSLRAEMAKLEAEQG